MNAEATKDKAKSDAKAVNKDGKKLNLFEHPGENAPVLPSINDSMKFDLIINDKKKSMLIVDTPFPEILYWAEYDLDMDELYFVTVRGKILPLGKKVATMFRPFMSQATYITAVRMQGEKLADNQRVPLIVRLDGAQFNRVAHAGRVGAANETNQTAEQEGA
ncbi:MAG: hypothetical protein VX740_07545 [Pseudomonadota bacterium]|jgi:hypothetical protein|nr:hypothetical protein [Alphaproteobacteria bacterium]MEC7703009.1 hypothetical protein [Pseudomonadota bacterium]MED5423278.1 hypothetical protein [Pseudomonadota bacterium]MEE3323549.1 hypothetical protein [Pseudomonadota bacterium]|tara:strand:+ start:470 stop:955 length:486 start_codon:yes stop_codon:yes gene_type:complete